MNIDNYIYGAITILSLFGFVMTTFGERLRVLPDQFDSPIRAAGFGIVALATGIGVIGSALIVTLYVLFAVLSLMNYW